MELIESAQRTVVGMDGKPVIKAINSLNIQTYRYHRKSGNRTSVTTSARQPFSEINSVRIDRAKLQRVIVTLRLSARLAESLDMVFLANRNHSSFKNLMTFIAVSLSNP